MREKEKYILLQDPIKFSDLDIGDCFIFLSKYLKNSIVYKKITNDSYRSELDPRIKINEHDEKFFVTKLDKDYIQFNEENKTTATPPETKEKEKCNHRFQNELFLIFSQNNHIFCDECHLHLGKLINKPIFDNTKSTQKGLIVLNKSKERYLEEFQARFINCEIGIEEDKYIDLENNQSTSIDQTSIINNQASKIAAQETEIKRLEKIIINQAEIIGKGSNG